MHPDKKVGLALGILLIGITGAFFFRNDALSETDSTPTLSDPESLDQQISQKPGAPYFPEEDSDDSVAESELAQVPDSLASKVVPTIPDVSGAGLSTILPEPLRPDSETFTDRTAPLPPPDRDLAAIGEGISLRALEASLLTDSELNQEEALQAISEASLPISESPRGDDASSSLESETEAEFITHEVVAGDNLSRLAQRYLGSHARYLKLYEANRHVLSSPNDLAPGMKLRIPVESTSTSTSKKTAVGRKVTGREDSPATAKKKSATSSFVKPDRSRFMGVGRTSARPGRSLSQKAPPGLPRVEGFSPNGGPAVIASRPDDELRSNTVSE